MQVIKLAYIKKQDLSSYEFFEALLQLSSMKNEDCGFSFVVKLDCIDAHLADIDTDEETWLLAPAYTPNLRELATELRANKLIGLYVANHSDDLNVQVEFTS